LIGFSAFSVSLKLRTKIVIFADTTKYFDKKMHKNCFFYDFEVSFYYFGFKTPHIYKKQTPTWGAC